MNNSYKYRILILNGVNLCQLGSREINIYGQVSFEEYLRELQMLHTDCVIEFKQEDEEGRLSSLIANAKDYDGIILNAGAYTHSSMVLADAVGTTSCPVIEVHISNIFGREKYRRESMLSSVCIGSISGFGLDSYHVAIEAIKKKKNNMVKL